MMFVETEASQAVVSKSLMKAVPMPNEFKPHTDDTHFQKSDDRVNVFLCFQFLTVLVTETL